jgi:hypothetical protein
MAELDIENIGPMLKRVKIAQLEPELLQGVLELAQEHGYEVTVTSLSDLHFLFRIYQAEKAKEERSLQLKKAEDLILRLAGLYSLHHEAERRQAKERADSDAEHRRKPRTGLAEEDITVGKRMRGLFAGIGIREEGDVQRAIAMLGEAKAEERVGIILKSSLGDELVKAFFAENPDTVWLMPDERFLDELNAMEAKKGIIDAWSGSRNEPPPLWADYRKSPSVLLVDFEVVLAGLGIGKGAGGGGGEKTTPDVPHAIGKPREGAGRDDAVEDMGIPALAPEAERAYSEAGGGAAGRLAALKAMGVDVTRLDSVRESISGDPQSGSRSKEQQRFDSGIAFIFDLVASGKLEGALLSSLGSGGLALGKVGYLCGASGAFELQINDAGGRPVKRVYLSMQDMGPAEIGKEAVEASGMTSHRIWTRDLAGTPFYGGGRRFALSEDARDVGRKGTIRIRMPAALAWETVATKGAAMFKEDLALRPDPDDELHRSFYAALSDPGGRKEMLRSLLAYFEMSRRALLPDRRPPNTFLLMVESGGRRSFVFQPTDMDGIGNFIDSAGDKPDFADYNNDFYKAAADFAVQMHEGMMRAAGKGMIRREGIPSPSRIVAELSAAAGEPFPPDGEEVRSARMEVFRRNDGSLIGIGFDASQYVGHTIPSQGGRGVILGTDGRVRLDAELASRTAEEAGTAEAQAAFLSGIRPSALAQLETLPAKIADIAGEMIEASAMPEQDEGARAAKERRLERLRNRTGGQIAAEVASDARVRSAEGEERERIAGRLAALIITGSGRRRAARRTAEGARAGAPDQ